MLTGTAILSGALTTAIVMGPVPQTTRASDTSGSIERVESSTGPGELRLTAFGVNNEPMGVIVLWYEGGGAFVALSDWPDGWAQTTVMSNGDIVTDPDSTLPPEVVSARAHAMATAAQDDDYGYYYLDEQRGWLGCIGGSVLTVAGMAAVNPWAVASTVLAACACLPLLIEEFEDLECP